jgi:tannase/feruloyl esterase
MKFAAAAVFAVLSASVAIVQIPASAAAPIAGPAAAASTACENLASVALPHAKIESAESIAAGAFTPPAPARGADEAAAGGAGRGGGRGPAPNPFANLAAFCRVRATLSPTADSDIKAEVWLPASNWNGKYQAVGGGGWAGVISYPAMAAAVRAGYATASTDTGHSGGTADFALNHQEKLNDFGYRAIHETTAFAKPVIDAFYGAAPKISFFNGCSTGGRQAITEAQRYPNDFDAIVAGASAWDGMRMHSLRIAVSQQINASADGVIPQSKLPMIHAAVLDACDALDAVTDGVIENPLQCHYDYAKLACKGADGPDCLTPGQVNAAKVLTSPLTDVRTGKVIDQRHLWPGSELGWTTLGGAQPLGLSVSGLANILFKDPRWDWRSFEVAKGMEAAAKADGGALFSGDPNLKPFFSHGGKLLMYHGWTDQQVTPQTSTIYYEKVLKTVGSDAASKGIALFMVPGMNHCQGGAGTDTFDKMAAIESWVATGAAPRQIIASHQTAGAVDKTRPLCPFPQVAKYKGAGDTNDAASFSCAAP